MSPQIKARAIVLTDGLLDSSDAKTAHGLIRGTERYEIAAIIDRVHKGKDAGIVLDGKHRNIPIYETVEASIEAVSNISFCIIGVATVGGILPSHFIPTLETCLRHRISLVNGLHELLSDIPSLVQLAAENSCTLTDIRKPKTRKELHSWTGSIFSVKAPVIAVIGTDCALGKRTTCRLVMQACEKAGISAAMIYTGQTGWLQGGQYGFIFDSTLNDFIAGELEHAIVSCYKDTAPQVILVEGQSALRNPFGPCGSEMLISGNAKQVILVHAPKRMYFEHDPAWGKIPDIESEIALIKLLGSEVMALALNTEHCSKQDALQYQQDYRTKLGIPVLLPLEEGVEEIIPAIRDLTLNRK